MTYDIKLRIGYQYDHPAGSSRTILRMSPLRRPGQQLVTGLLETDPLPQYRRDGLDFFGNAITELAFDHPMERLEFHFRGRVKVQPAETGLDLSCGLSDLPAEISGVRSIGPASPHNYLGNSPRIALADEFSDFAREVLGSGPRSAHEGVLAICQALHEEFEFDARATDVTTPPLVSFRNRRGVCQDISHVAIALLRAVGIPAGYVSGFLRTIPPAGKPRLEGADAMHAWVRAWCGSEMGWIEIDPTNAMRAGTDHVAVAVGRDYFDIAPVKGSMRSIGSHKTFQKVDVVPVQ